MDLRESGKDNSNLLDSPLGCAYWVTINDELYEEATGQDWLDSYAVVIDISTYSFSDPFDSEQISCEWRYQRLDLILLPEA